MQAHLTVAVAVELTASHREGSKFCTLDTSQLLLLSNLLMTTTYLRCRARVTHRPRRRRQHPRQRSEGFHRALLRAATLFGRVVYAAGGSNLTVAAVALGSQAAHFSSAACLPLVCSWRAAAASKQPTAVVMSSWCPCGALNGLSGCAC